LPAVERHPGAAVHCRSNAATAWQQGLRLGLHCTHCCVGLLAILPAIGVTDLRAMAVVAAAITSNVSHRPGP
jgi:predicted metal-binding membrane protein